MFKNNNLTVEKAINELDGLKFLEEVKPEGFYCSRFSQEGIIIITNLRISFYFINSDNEFAFEHFVYAMTSKASFNINNKTSFIDLNYAYDKHKFNFLYKKDIIQVKKLLELYIPDKVKIDVFEEGQQIFPEEEVVVENTEPSNNETRPLIQIDTSAIDKNFWKMYFNQFGNLAIKITIALLLLFFIPQYFTTVSNLVLKGVSYGVNFIKIQQCESQFVQMAKAINDFSKNNGKLPEDMTDFLKHAVKSNLSRNPGQDPWGSMVAFRDQVGSFRLISFGPDKTRNTYDDFEREFKKVKVNDKDPDDI